MNKKKVLGIDLGTTNCCVAIMTGGKTIKIIENSEGKRTTPSVLSFGADGNLHVGDIAKRQACTNVANTIFAFKRLIGKKYADVKSFADRLPFKVVADKNGNASMFINGKNMSPVEASALLLKKLVEIAKPYLDDQGAGEISVVITVPAHFDNAQREATKQAGEIAGLKVERVINEPTAAAMAYGLDSAVQGSILVYDLGGGTFDVTILNIEDGVCQVVATDGDSELGGEDFDNLLTDNILSKFSKQNPSNNVRNDNAAMYRIKEASKQAKETLSTSAVTNVSIPYIAPGPLNLDVQVSRGEFEGLIRRLIDNTIETVKKIMQEAKTDISDIKSVVLVGGSTRLPMIQEKLAAIFGASKIKKDINPDEAVAQGAAIQGGIISGDYKDVVLIDVTSLTLGIESVGGIMTPIVEKSTAIPAQKSKIFTTYADNQTSVQITIYQGERKFVTDCKKLGSFMLDGITPAKAQVPKIEVTFEIDANGLLNVLAKDQQTGSKQSVTLQPEVGLTDEEIARMKKEAEEQHENDLAKEKIVVAKHDLISCINQIENEASQLTDKLSEDVKNKIAEFKESANKIINEEKSDEYETKKTEGFAILQELMSLKNNKDDNNSQQSEKNTESAKEDNSSEAKPENTEESSPNDDK